MLSAGYNRDREIARANFSDGFAIGIVRGEALGIARSIIARGVARGEARGEARGRAIALDTMKQLASQGLTLEDAIKIISQQLEQPSAKTV